MALSSYSMFNMVKKGLILILLLGLVFLGLIARAINQSRLACFRVDALERYLTAYERIEGKKIERLADLPPFHVVSFNDSFSLKDTDLKKGTVDGYIFDYRVLENGQYIVSASPVGLFAPEIEYGVTEDGVLRRNKTNIDGDPDTHAEVIGWEKIPRSETIHSAQGLSP